MRWNQSNAIFASLHFAFFDSVRAETAVTLQHVSIAAQCNRKDSESVNKIFRLFMVRPVNVHRCIL